MREWPGLCVVHPSLCWAGKGRPLSLWTEAKRSGGQARELFQLVAEADCESQPTPPWSAPRTLVLRLRSFRPNSKVPAYITPSVSQPRLSASTASIPLQTHRRLHQPPSPPSAYHSTNFTLHIQPHVDHFLSPAHGIPASSISHLVSISDQSSHLNTITTASLEPSI